MKLIRERLRKRDTSEGNLTEVNINKHLPKKVKINIDKIHEAFKSALYIFMNKNKSKRVIS